MFACNPSFPAAGPLCVEVRFSPRGGCTEAVCREIAAARQEILVQAFSFTSPAIAGALLDAHRRGLRVAVLLDAEHARQRNGQAAFLARAGVEVLLDARHLAAGSSRAASGMPISVSTVESIIPANPHLRTNTLSRSHSRIGAL